MPTITTTPLTTPTIGTDPAPSTEVYLPADPVFVKVFDNSASTFTDLTTEANNAAANDVPFLPDPLGSGDIAYIGSTKRFDTLLINMGTAGEGTYGAIWEYHNGVTWTTLSFLYDSASGIDNLRASGHNALFLIPPTDMETQQVDSQTAFWIRLRVTSIGAGYVQPLGTQVWIRKVARKAAQIINIQMI
jgi:hypothetical protein